MRRSLALLLFLTLQLARAACALEGEPIVLNIQDFGTAYFRDFTLDGARNSAEFHNGVCLHGADGSWTVNARSLDLTGIQPGRPINVQASEATLELPDWYITAEHLSSDGEEFHIEGGSFSGENLSGTVARVVLQLNTGLITGQDLQAEGPGFRVQGASARFQGETLTLQQAFVTTCKCPGDPVYRLHGDEAVITMAAGGGQVTLYHGALEVAGLRFGLDETFVLSNDTLSALSPPVLVEWDPAPAGQEERGRGLSVLVLPLKLHDQASLEFGITGLDAEHPLSGFFLFQAETDDARLRAGYSRGGGPLAEVSVQEQLGQYLQLTLGTNHRHYPQQSYLHEGYLSVATTFPVQNLAGSARVAWGGSITAALSSQVQAGESVVSPRLRSAVFADWRLPQHPAGVFSVRTDFELSHYSGGRQQFGLRLRPGWTRTFGSLRLSLSHDLQVTDSGSPFTTTLDRLTPASRTVFSARVADQELAEGLTFSASLRFDYNWLRFTSGERRGTEELLLTAGLSWQPAEDAWRLAPELRLQFAGLLDPRATPERLAFIEGRFTAERDDIELGFRSRYHFGGRNDGLETLELAAAYPLQFQQVKLVPFLALDFAPLIAADEGLLLSGHGLMVEWDSCCGLFEFGYRVHGDEFITTLNAEFIR